MANPPMFTEDEIAEYRVRKDEEKANAADLAAEQAKLAAKEARANLESSLEAKFIAAGGTKAEWLSVKRQIV